MKKLIFTILVILLSVIALSSYRILDIPGTSALRNTPYDQHMEYFFKELDDSIIYIYDTWDGDGSFALLRYGKNGEIITPYRIHRSPGPYEKRFDIEIGEEHFFELKEARNGLFKLVKYSLDGVPMGEYIFENEDNFAYKSDYSPFRQIDIDAANIVLNSEGIFVDFVSINSLQRGKYELAIFRFEIDENMKLTARKLLGYRDFEYNPQIISFGSRNDNFFLWLSNKNTKDVVLYTKNNELGLYEQYSFNYNINFSTRENLFQMYNIDDYSLIVYPSLYQHLEDTYFIPSILLIKDNNINKVLKASNGDIGYMHITGMMSRNVAQFDKFWRAFRYKKGLIIDVRGNGGGWTEYFIIDKLERKMTAFNCLKNMVPFRYPGSVSNGHLAVVTNEYNGSDGEAFIEHFKASRLGTVIGVPSWGGLVGIINGQKTIDNGTVHQSNNAFYGRERKWLVENHGADPDMVVENDPASVMAGHDKQLETAIEVLMKQIKNEPFVFPEKPDYPVK